MRLQSVYCIVHYSETRSVRDGAGEKIRREKGEKIRAHADKFTA